MLHALYYPFSRCIDSGALKQLLLVFDSIAFLDPVSDDEWRAKLFRDLEIAEDRRFAQYRDLEGPLRELKESGVIAQLNPEDLGAYRSPLTAVGAITDLSDPEWCQVAARPGQFGLPHRALGPDGRATWQIFPQKLAPPIRDLIDSDTNLGTHFFSSARTDSSWTLSYEAGSAATMNLHLVAAAELDLAPVTDSTMHHRLLIRKLVRNLSREPSWARPESTGVVDILATQVAVRLIHRLLPRSALASASFDSIIAFRDKTKAARATLVADLSNRMQHVETIDDPAKILQAQRDLGHEVEQELEDYRHALLGARDKLWPGLLQSATAGGLAAGGIGALASQLLVGGPLSLLAGSIAGASLAAAKPALEYRAERKKVQRSATASLAYLSRVLDA